MRPLNFLRQPKTLIIFVVAMLIIYIPLFSNQFISLDDPTLIVNNPLLQTVSFGNIWQMLTSFDPELYVPLTSLSYLVDRILFQLSSFGVHLTNLLMHIANAILVGWFALKVSKRRSIALLVMIFFAVHPIQTEAVAWASARKDLLSSFFFLLSINFYLSYKDGASKRWYLGSLAFFLCALLSKVSVAFLPIALLLFCKKNWKELIPYFCLSVLFGIIALFGKGDAVGSGAMVESLLIIPKSITFYLWKLTVPTGLSLLYPQAEAITFTSLEFQFPLIFLVIISAIIFLWKKWSKAPLFWWLFFLIALTPSFFASHRGEKYLDVYFASDRYVYLASIAFFMISALIVNYLAANFRKQKMVVWGLAGVIVLILSVITYGQVGLWQNSGTLYRHVLNYYPKAHIAKTGMGNYYREQKRFEDAIAAYRSSLKIQETAEAAYNLGVVLNRTGRIPDALEAYEKAIEINPNFAAAYLNIGAIYIKTNRPQDAVEYFLKVTEIDADAADPYFNLGVAYALQELDQEAIEAFETFLRREPNRFGIVAMRLAKLYIKTGRSEDAKVILDQVLQIDQENEEASELIKNI